MGAVDAPARKASATSPPSLSAASVSTNTRARRSASSSASRISRLKAPTRSRCWPSRSHAPAISGAARQRRAADDVGGARRALQILGDANAPTLRGKGGGELFGPGATMVPYRHLIDRPNGGVGAHQERGERAGPDHQQPARVAARQKPRGESRRGGGAPVREARSVHHGERLAGVARLQNVELRAPPAGRARRCRERR